MERMSNTEWEAQKSQESELYLDPSVKTAEEMTRKISEDAIDPRLFIDIYGADAVARDLNHVEELKKLFSKGNQVQKIYASFLERMIYHHGAQSFWLGEDVETILVAEYDDFVNGIDLALRINNSTSAFPYLGVGIDVTFGTTGMEKKISRIFNEIESGRLGKIRYFMDPNEDSRFKGELSKIPHLVLGVERRHVVELAQQYLHKSPREFAENPIQLVILKQMMEQFKVFRDYAERIGKHDIAEIYTADMAVFAPVLRDRRRMDIRNYENDHVAAALSQELSARK